jgi:hypothetical protein
MVTDRIPAWLEPHPPVCEALVAPLHPCFEMAVRDNLRDWILAIGNPISGGKVGHRSLIDGLPDDSGDVRVVGPYPTVPADGRATASVFVVLPAAEGAARGALSARHVAAHAAHALGVSRMTIDALLKEART